MFRCLTLLQRPIWVEDIKLTANVKNASNRLPRDGTSESEMHADFHRMTAYWKWVAQLYGGDVITASSRPGQTRRSLESHSRP